LVFAAQVQAAIHQDLPVLNSNAKVGAKERQGNRPASEKAGEERHKVKYCTIKRFIARFLSGILVSLIKNRSQEEDVASWKIRIKLF